MANTFSDSLKSLRKAQGLSQQQLASKLFVDRSTVARWESGARLPDAQLMVRIAATLGTDTNALFDVATKSNGQPEVICVDDERVVLTGTLNVLTSAFPNAAITGFERTSEALGFARSHYVSLAFLDIEMGRTSGLALCTQLLEINPRTNVVFLTAYRDYALDAWETGACGFLLKPITVESVRNQSLHLRYPIPSLVQP